MNVFDQLAPFIKDYIYKNKWDEMREIQVAACDIIFNSKDNLLLASGTASGKTEAAFLPILTELYNEPSASVGVLYVSPLKSLINDQFERLEELLQEIDIPVNKWHGDVGYNKKKKLMDKPEGILQITPESLEVMLLHRKADVIKLFSDLRYIIIDEVHYFMANERGIQLLSILERIERLAQINPRRVGLSATLGDYVCASQWLNAGKNQKCIVPETGKTRKTLRLRMEYFDLYKTVGNGEKYYNFIYEVTLGKKCIIFANSRKQTEHTIAMLKKIAESRHTEDIYRIHHGSIAASIREETEREMKESEKRLVTGATVTLELGVDIGRLDRVVQLQSTHTVSSFVQRLGRCGRRGKPAEMFFAFAKNTKLNDDVVQNIDWDFINGIASIQLYIEEQWIEPGYIPKLPLSLLYHQTMSYVASMGEVTASNLAQFMLTLYPFKHVTQEQYKKLLQHMLEIDHLEKSESGGIIIGLKGEKHINHYEFCTVFISQVEYTVNYDNRKIGTVETLYPVDWQFQLGGHSWKVVSNSEKSKMIYVIPVAGISDNNWRSPVIVDKDTKVLQKMKAVLTEDVRYAYLSEDAYEELKEMRLMFRNSNLDRNTIIESADKKSMKIFPWIGTKGLRVLKYALREHDIECDINYTGIWLDVGAVLSKNVLTETINKICGEGKKQLILEDGEEIAGKYNPYISQNLLAEQFYIDALDFDDLRNIKLV